MKPPWKFLTQLMSRQRPSEKPDQTGERDIDRKPAEAKLQSASEPLSVLPQAAPGLEYDHESPTPDPVDKATTDTSTVDTGVPATLTAAADLPALAPTVEADEPLSMPQWKPSRVKRKSRVSPTAQSPVAAVGEPVRQFSSASGDPFFDEATSLDEDIKQLKDQLAQKLRLQNAQLRTMLKRFESSQST